MIRTCQALAISLALAPMAHAWENHALATKIAVSQMPELLSAPKVPAESLEDFLSAEQVRIAKILEDEERWAGSQVAKYPARPSPLAFKSAVEHKELRTRFLNAIRVNPQAKFTLYLQQLPGTRIAGATYLPLGAVTLLPKSLSPTQRYFAAIAPGQMVAPSDVFATASDEPDYGLDIKLWDDSGTDFGRQYHFGPQPFGNPKLEFSSQAPFHMGYFHESEIIFLAADYLTHTLPEARIHLFYSLARFAFQTGHPYWGWRFAGIGSHYIQDLTQPFHTTVMPGESTAKILLTGLLDMFGIHGPKERMIEEVSAQHLAIENQVYCSLVKALITRDETGTLVTAIRNTKSDQALRYSDAYVRDVLAAESHGFADRTATAMQQILPSQPLIAKAQAAAPSLCAMAKVSKSTDRLLAQLMKNFGVRTREFVRAIQAR